MFYILINILNAVRKVAQMKISTKTFFCFPKPCKYCSVMCFTLQNAHPLALCISLQTDKVECPFRCSLAIDTFPIWNAFQLHCPLSYHGMYILKFNFTLLKLAKLTLHLLCMLQVLFLVLEVIVKLIYCISAGQKFSLIWCQSSCPSLYVFFLSLFLFHFV